MSNALAVQKPVKACLYSQLKDLIDQLESLKPYFAYLKRDKQLLADLILLKKDRLLIIARKLDEGVNK